MKKTSSSAAADIALRLAQARTRPPAAAATGRTTVDDWLQELAEGNEVDANGVPIVTEKPPEPPAQ